MIDTKYPELFYQDSPFLPIISDEDIEEMVQVLKSKDISLLETITLQSSYIADAVNILHENHLSWIISSFECSGEDIMLFYLGFTTTSVLILSAIQMNNATMQTVIKNLTIPTNHKVIKEHNKYKISILHDIYNLISHKPNHKLNSVFNLLLSLFRQKPFNPQNKYYHAGIEAGIYTHQLLFKKYQEQIQATS